MKQKRPDLARAAKKNSRGEADLSLLTELWDSDFSSFKQLLLDHLLVQYPLPEDTEECSSFSAIFQFSLPPKHPADMNAIGGILVSSRDSRSTNVGKKNKGGESQVSSIQTLKSTKQLSSPALTTTLATVIAQTSSTPIPGTPAGTTDIGKYIHAAKLVFLAPSGNSKTKLLRELRFPTLKSQPIFKTLVQEYSTDLVSNKVEALLMGRVLFDWVEPNNDKNLEIDFKKAYVQPGLVRVPTPINPEETNFLEVIWLQCSDKDVLIPQEVQLQYASDESPYVLFHEWDELNTNPCDLFSLQQYNNGTWFFSVVYDFLPDLVPSTSSKRKSTKESSLCKTDAKRSRSELPKKASAIRDALMPVVEDIVEQLENGLLKPSLFLDSRGNWPVCI